MRIILKYVWKNICEKKMRTALILFTVILSSALFFASTAISDTTIKIYTQGAKKFSGSSDIMIKPGEKSDSQYFYNVNIPEQYQDSMEFMIGVINENAFYKHTRDDDVKMTLQGIDWEDLQIMNPVRITQESAIEPFSGKKIIISEEMASKYGLEIGSILPLLINGKEYKFSVCAISLPVGPFLSDGKTVVGIVPKDVLGSIFSDKGAISTLYIKLKDPTYKKAITEELSSLLTRYKVQDVISLEEAKETTKLLSVVFSVVLVIVLLLSVFIIFSTFKVITSERMPVIGTFRSIGATRRTTSLVLLGESVAYGVIGGLIGCACGLGILYLISMLIAPSWGGGTDGVQVVYSISQLVGAFTIAIVLCLFSSLVPVIKVANLPLKDIVLDKVEVVAKQQHKLKLFIGLVLLIFVIVAPRTIQGAAAIYIDALCMVFTIGLIALLTPYIIIAFVTFFEIIYAYIFGNEGILAVKNLRDNKNLVSNTVMIAIGIASLLMISTVSQSVVSGIIDTFSNANYHLQFSMPKLSRSIQQVINSTEGVDDTSGFYMASDVKVEGSPNKITYLEGVDKKKYLEFMNVNFAGNAKAALEQLDSGRNVILNQMHKSWYNVKEGDTIVLDLGDDKKRTYTVTGFMDTMWMGGNYAITSDYFLKMDFRKQHFDYIRLKTKEDPVAILKVLKRRFSDSTTDGIITSELKNNIVTANTAMFTILQAFSVLAILIGILGVLNNVLISFIQRKRSLALLRSIGMSKSQIVKMIFIEAFTGGVIGGATGVIGGVMLISIMPLLLREVMATVLMNYSMFALIGSFLSGIIITVAASISPAMKSSKMNIIQSLKYE